MRLMLALLVLLFSQMSHSLSGEWKLSDMMYKGQLIGLPNPDLNLRWNFFSNGTSRLYWDRGGRKFCERFASFSVNLNLLSETVFALNPHNAVDCKSDPDMQLGRETKTKIQIQPNQIFLHFPMGDEELIYILKEVL